MYPSTRKVRSNGRTVVGHVSSTKKAGVQFESSLEEGFLYILHFDSDVTCFHDQPLQIKYKDSEGVSRRYTPDFLVEYNNRNNVLFEVKSKEFVEKHKKELDPVFKAARHFALMKGWNFEIVTDQEIKTEYCENARSLFRYQTYFVELEVSNKVMDTLSRIGTSTPNLLLDEISSNDNQRAIYIAAIWTLVLNKKIECNLFTGINMETPISISQNGKVKELKYPYYK